MCDRHLLGLRNEEEVRWWGALGKNVDSHIALKGSQGLAGVPGLPGASGLPGSKGKEGFVL